jgi:hypothetical protein
MSDDRPQHSGGFTGSVSAVRAGIILVAFVVGVAILVAVGTRPTVTSPASSAQTTVPPASTTATTAHGGSTTTTAHGASTTSTTHTGGAGHTTTTAKSGHHHGAATTTTTVAPSTVSVVVANGTQTSGLAAHFSSVIGAGGWSMQTPINAATSVSTSAVYYAPGMQGPATAVANAIGVKPAQVLPISSATPVSSVAGMDVIAVIGQDLANAATNS